MNRRSIHIAAAPQGRGGDLITQTALLLGICLAAVAAFLFLYLHDNKYTAAGPQAFAGVLSLDEATLTAHPTLMLVEGWAYYDDVLLTPEDFAQKKNAPDRFVFIGQYAGFELDDPKASPHGSATYRLSLRLPETPDTYTLALPEIFSAYRAYVNDSLVAELGNPDPARYHPETLSHSITFEASGETVLLLAVSDFSHFYSGMVYPPIFGAPEAVSQLLSAHFSLRALPCAVALLTALLAVFIGVLSRQRRTAVLFALTCLFFVGYIAYPIFKSFLRAYFPFYALEQISYCAMLVTILLLWRRLCDLRGKWSLIVPGFGMLLCLYAVLMHATLSAGVKEVFYTYSQLLTAFQWFTACDLTISAVYLVRHVKRNTQPVFGGILVFDMALVTDRFLPQYEPIVGGWFPEIASFVLVLTLGVMTAKQISAQYRKTLVLEQHADQLGRLFAMQRSYYPALLDKITEAKTARHDLRHHTAVVAALLEQERYEELKAYFSAYQRHPADEPPLRYCENEIADIIAHHYAQRAADEGVALDLQLDIRADLALPPDDLSALLSNLLENAMEACAHAADEQPFLSLIAKTKGGMLTLHMANSCIGAEETQDGFLSTKSTGRQGLGLSSIDQIARRYQGRADFRFDAAAGAFVSRVMLQTNTPAE